MSGGIACTITNVQSGRVNVPVTFHWNWIEPPNVESVVTDWLFTIIITYVSLFLGPFADAVKLAQLLLQLADLAQSGSGLVELLNKLFSGPLQKTFSVSVNANDGGNQATKEATLFPVVSPQALQSFGWALASAALALVASAGALVLWLACIGATGGLCLTVAPAIKGILMILSSVFSTVGWTEYIRAFRDPDPNYTRIAQTSTQIPPVVSQMPEGARNLALRLLQFKSTVDAASTSIARYYAAEENGDMNSMLTQLTAARDYLENATQTWSGISAIYANNVPLGSLDRGQIDKAMSVLEANGVPEDIADNFHAVGMEPFPIGILRELNGTGLLASDLHFQEGFHLVQSNLMNESARVSKDIEMVQHEMSHPVIAAYSYYLLAGLIAAVVVGTLYTRKRRNLRKRRKSGGKWWQQPSVSQPIGTRIKVGAKPPKPPTTAKWYQEEKKNEPWWRSGKKSVS